MEQNIKTKIDTNSLGRMLFLAVFSIALASFFPLLAPFPLVLAFLFSGRIAGLNLSVVSLVILGLASYFAKFPVALPVTYFFVIVFGFLIAEIFFRNIEPMKGIKYTSWIILLLFCAIIIVTYVSLGSGYVHDLKSVVIAGIEKFKTQNTEIFENAGADGETLKAMFNEPDKMIREVLYWSPAAIFVTIFVSVWASVLMILKNGIIWKRYVNYHYTGHNILKYKTPDFLVYPLIIALALMLGGEYLFGHVAYYVGGNALYCLAVFYFFQGFGIYLDFLAFARIRGILRTLMVAFTILMAWKLLVLIGVFDLWFDFRKFIRRKSKNEGDII